MMSRWIGHWAVDVRLPPLSPVSPHRLASCKDKHTPLQSQQGLAGSYQAGPKFIALLDISGSSLETSPESCRVDDAMLACLL